MYNNFWQCRQESGDLRRTDKHCNMKTTVRMTIQFKFITLQNFTHIASTVARTMVRKRYSISQKLSMARTLETRCGENGESLRSVARELGVDPSQLRRWKSQIAQFEDLLSHNNGTSVTAVI